MDTIDSIAVMEYVVSSSDLWIESLEEDLEQSHVDEYESVHVSRKDESADVLCTLETFWNRGGTIVITTWSQGC